MYLALVLVGLIVVAVVFAVVMTRRRAASVRVTPAADAPPESMLADLDDSQTHIEDSAADERHRATGTTSAGLSSPTSSSAAPGPGEGDHSDGVFRVSVQRPGPDADEVLDILRKHSELREVGGGEYDARLHGDMQSGTAIAQMVHVLDRERADWAQQVTIRPGDDP